MFAVKFRETARDQSARAGVATTHRGEYETPCFMPVGTRGAIRHLSAQDYEELGARIVLGNTYHLMLRPGAQVVSDLGGLGAFAGWKGLTLTDSGGFQVFSLNPDVDDEGVSFRSTYDGSMHRFTPESAVITQQLLGADIQMVLDVCASLPATDEVIKLALKRTSNWAARAKATHTRSDQSLFGIVQGGIRRTAVTEAAPAALHVARARPAIEAAFRLPTTESEKALAAIWCEVMGVEGVGAEDPFLSLGGDSLLAIRMIARVRSDLQVALPLRAVYELPTIAALAERVDAVRWAQADPPDGHGSPAVETGTL